MRTAVRLFLAVDALAALTIVYFFIWGLTDGTVSSFNAGLWAGLLAAAIGIPVGGYLLHRSEQHGAALALLALMAAPSILAGLFILVLIVEQPRWN